MKRFIMIMVMLVIAALVVLPGCATRAQEGALIGGGVGAGAGALIGGASGNPVPGAIIGGAVGATTGAVIGNERDHNRRY